MLQKWALRLENMTQDWTLRGAWHSDKLPARERSSQPPESRPRVQDGGAPPTSHPKPRRPTPHLGVLHPATMLVQQPLPRPPHTTTSKQDGEKQFLPPGPSIPPKQARLDPRGLWPLWDPVTPPCPSQWPSFPLASTPATLRNVSSLPDLSRPGRWSGPQALGRGTEAASWPGIQVHVRQRSLHGPGLLLHPVRATVGRVRIPGEAFRGGLPLEQTRGPAHVFSVSPALSITSGTAHTGPAATASHGHEQAHRGPPGTKGRTVALSTQSAGWGSAPPPPGP